MSLSPEKLKELLVPKHINESDFDMARNEAKEKEITLDELLIRKGLIKDSVFGEIVAKETGRKFVDLETSQINNINFNILGRIPEAVAYFQKTVPIEENENTLKVITSHPDNYNFIKFLKKKTGKEIEVLYVTPNKINQALGRYKGVSYVEDKEPKKEELEKKDPEKKPEPSDDIKIKKTQGSKERKNLLKQAEEHFKKEEFERAVIKAEEVLIKPKSPFDFISRFFKKDKLTSEAKKIIDKAGKEISIENKEKSKEKEKIKENYRRAIDFLKKKEYTAASSFADEIIEALESPREKVLKKIKKETSLLEEAKKLKAKAEKERLVEEDKEMAKEIRRKAKEESARRKQEEKEKKTKGKDKEKEELKTKLDDVFQVIEKNKEQISQLKQDLEKKERVIQEKEDGAKESDKKDLDQEKKHIDFIKEKVREEHEKLNQRERELRQRETAAREISESDINKEADKIDLIKRKIKEEHEKFDRGRQKDSLASEGKERIKEASRSFDDTKRDQVQDDDYQYAPRAETVEPPRVKEEYYPPQVEEKRTASPQPEKIVRERIIERTRDSSKGEIRKEIEEILKEKSRLIEEKSQLKEIKEKEEKIKEEKRKLEERSNETKDGEEKKEIKKRVKEMEEELRKLIKEETSEKWEERISGVEDKIATMSKKHEELTKKEKHLRDKIKKMQEWGPAKRKKQKDDYFEYRTIYKEPLKQKKESSKRDGESTEGEKKKKNLINNFVSRIKSIKPNKDFFLKMPLLISIDISDFSIEVLCVSKKGMLISYGRSILEEGIVYNGEIRDKGKLEKAIMETFKNAKPDLLEKKKKSRMKAIITLPYSKTFIHQFKVGKDENILEKTKQEIGKIIPIPLDDLYFHYHAVNLPETKEKSVLCVAVPKTAVNEYIDFLQQIDIDPFIFDIEDAAKGRALLEAKKNENVSEMIVDIGARSTTISVFRNNILLLSINIPFGGAYFTDKIAKKFGIPKEEAEERKKESGLQGELKDILTSSLEVITEEIKKLEDYYYKEFNSEMNKIILTGGSALLNGILDYFEKEFNEKVEIGNPLQKMKTIKELSEQDSIVFVNVIGLSLRTMDTNSISNGFNMLPEDIRRKEKRYQQERKKTFLFAAIVVVIIGLSFLGYALYHFYVYYFN